eukprot:scaffold15389_cov131-Isochrysis_galbana.AAC.2
MAPRQLLLELEEVDMAADKGPKRVRVDHADESSTQQKTPSGVAAPPNTITAKAVHYNPFRGFPNFKPILDMPCLYQGIWVGVRPYPLQDLACRSQPGPLGVVRQAGSLREQNAAATSFVRRRDRTFTVHSIELI